MLERGIPPTIAPLRGGAARFARGESAVLLAAAAGRCERSNSAWARAR